LDVPMPAVARLTRGTIIVVVDGRNDWSATIVYVSRYGFVP
jgi:hypothetical protein